MAGGVSPTWLIEVRQELKENNYSSLETPGELESLSHYRGFNEKESYSVNKATGRGSRKHTLRRGERN